MTPVKGDRSAIRVTVLRGGPSPERDVSLASGKAVADALRRCGYQVSEADVDPNDLSALDKPADVIFPVLHGTFGEDGTLQRIMEQRGLCFVGSGAEASALAMDKVASKKLVRRMGFDTPPFEVWTADMLGQPPPNAPASIREDPLPVKIPLPVVVKPTDQGSSVATTIVREKAELADTIRKVTAEHGRALVERFIAGDELTVGILGGEPLPPICVRPKRTFYDYAAKYEDDATEYLFDAGHDPALLQRAQDQSRAVFAQFGCRHLGRIDWMVDEEGRLWFLEANTIPGFTSHSLVPKAAARMGRDFEHLCDWLVTAALETS